MVPCVQAANDKPPTALQRFCLTTSMKGISRAVRTDEKIMRAMWLIAGGVGICMALYLALIILSAYFSYDVVTRTTEVSGSVPPFPDHL